jgi:Mce-associated membrane protein
VTRQPRYSGETVCGNRGDEGPSVNGARSLAQAAPEALTRLSAADPGSGSKLIDITTQIQDEPTPSTTPPASDDHETSAVTTEPADDDEVAKPRRTVQWRRVLASVVLPILALALAVTAGFLKWQNGSAGEIRLSRIESVQAAKDSTAALLSYKPDSVEKDLGAARDMLTGQFRDSYTSLTNDVVIPGARQRQITATAAVPAAASVNATVNHAVVLVFVNQTVAVGAGAPIDTASAVRVTLELVGNHWLISAFDPM